MFIYEYKLNTTFLLWKFFGCTNNIRSDYHTTKAIFIKPILTDSVAKKVYTKNNLWYDMEKNCEKGKYYLIRVGVVGTIKLMFDLFLLHCIFM